MLLYHTDKFSEHSLNMSEDIGLVALIFLGPFYTQMLTSNLPQSSHYQLLELQSNGIQENSILCNGSGHYTIKLVSFDSEKPDVIKWYHTVMSL